MHGKTLVSRRRAERNIDAAFREDWGAGQVGGRFHPSDQAKVPVIRLGRSSSGKRIMITGSPWSPGPTMSFGVPSALSVGVNNVDSFSVYNDHKE